LTVEGHPRTLSGPSPDRSPAWTSLQPATIGLGISAVRVRGECANLHGKGYWLSQAAGLPAIDLHDVRHSYATAGRNAKIDWKALSKRIGHADVAFTMKQYVQTDLEADREVANTLADLIIGGLLVTGIEDQGTDHNPADEGEPKRARAQIRAQTTSRRPVPCSEPASELGSGGGI